MMSKPDVVVSWPDNCDYPLWRKMIRENRDRFAKVIIVITKTNQGYNYTEFIYNSMKDLATIIESPNVEAGQDWRNVAVNAGLDKVTSNWVLFTEQDFYPKDSLWEYLKQFDGTMGTFAVYQGDRLHPCFILTDIGTILKTRRDFGIIAGVADHFFKFQEDLREENIYRISKEDYEHLNGLSHNMTLIYNDQQPNYEPERFKKYIEDCLACQEVLHPLFVMVCLNYLKLM